MYRKPNKINGLEQPKRVVRGIDISIHDVSFGVKNKINKGVKTFSSSRSIIDKVTILYKDKHTILRRCRDLYDLYLYSIENTEVEEDVLRRCIEYRSIDLNKKSIFEDLVDENDADLRKVLQYLIHSDIRVNKEYVKRINLTEDTIINEVLCVLDFLRRLLC